jgi:Rrf2 family protein
VLSRTGTYALQATLYLAGRVDRGAISSSEIASDLQAPAQYMGKVLRRLAVVGLLQSTRGAHGGYRLVVAPGEITVADVVNPFDGYEPPKACLMGGRCNLDDPCSAHARRLEWIEAQRRILRATTVADLLSSDPRVAAETLHAPTD